MNIFLLIWRAPFLAAMAAVLIAACAILSVLALFALRPGFIPEIWERVFGWFANDD